MKLYIVEANFYDGESSWTNLLSVRYDKDEAEQDKKEYEEIMSNNKKLAQSDYDILSEKLDCEEDESLNSKLSECEGILYSDFCAVTITEAELDKLLYSKEDLVYTSLIRTI